MGKIKSLVILSAIDRALRAHNCQGNSKHRINSGDIRLKVKNGRSWDHYCSLCAGKILEADISKLTELQSASLA